MIELMRSTVPRVVGVLLLAALALPGAGREAGAQLLEKRLEKKTAPAAPRPQTQTPQRPSREVRGVDFIATPGRMSREVSGVNFVATPGRMSREVAGVDFVATVGRMSREVAGVNFVAEGSR